MSEATRLALKSRVQKATIQSIKTLFPLSDGPSPINDEKTLECIKHIENLNENQTFDNDQRNTIIQALKPYMDQFHNTANLPEKFIKYSIRFQKSIYSIKLM